MIGAIGAEAPAPRATVHCARCVSLCPSQCSPASAVPPSPRQRCDCASWADSSERRAATGEQQHSTGPTHPERTAANNTSTTMHSDQQRNTHRAAACTAIVFVTGPRPISHALCELWLVGRRFRSSSHVFLCISSAHKLSHSHPTHRFLPPLLSPRALFVRTVHAPPAISFPPSRPPPHPSYSSSILSEQLLTGTLLLKHRQTSLFRPLLPRSLLLLLHPVLPPLPFTPPVGPIR